jgi:hypothetical protein
MASVKIIAGVTVIVGGISLWIAWPYLQRSLAIWQIERAGGSVSTLNSGARLPVWLRGLIANRWMRPFDEIYSVHLARRSDLAHLKAFPALSLTLGRSETRVFPMRTCRASGLYRT